MPGADTARRWLQAEFVRQIAQPRLLCKIVGNHDAPRLMIAIATPQEGRGAQRMQPNDSLDDLGFRHLRPPSQETDGPLAAFDVQGSYVGNVISHQADVEL
jgi:hypothetical protein